MVRYGIIGSGMMGVEHILNINAIEGADVVAASDPHPPSLDAAREAANSEIATFAGHRELLASGLCDAVVVASPNFTHVDILADVLAADVHVLIEKPLCVTVEQCQQVIATAGDEPVMSNGDPKVVWVGLEYRYMPAVAQLVDEVRAGAVGRPQMMAIREHRFPFLVKVDNWNRFSENTGGTLVEKCCHFFDLMNVVMDERPSRVFASGAQDVNHLDESYDGRTPDILDNAYVIVDYPSGRRALLDLCMFAEATHEQEEISVVGDTGKVEALLPSGTFRRGRRADHWIGDVEVETVHDESIAHEGLHHGSSYVEHVRFCAAVRGERPVDVTLDDGLWSVAVGVAAHRSIEEGRPVEIKEIMQ